MKNILIPTFIALFFFSCAPSRVEFEDPESAPAIARCFVDQENTDRILVDYPSDYDADRLYDFTLDSSGQYRGPANAPVDPACTDFNYVNDQIRNLLNIEVPIYASATTDGRKLINCGAYESNDNRIFIVQSVSPLNIRRANDSNLCDFSQTIETHCFRYDKKNDINTEKVAEDIDANFVSDCLSMNF